MAKRKALTGDKLSPAMGRFAKTDSEQSLRQTETLALAGRLMQVGIALIGRRVMFSRNKLAALNG